MKGPEIVHANDYDSDVEPIISIEAQPLIRGIASRPLPLLRYVNHMEIEDVAKQVQYGMRHERRWAEELQNR